MPPKPIRDLRNLTRYRKAQIRDRQREAGRLHKLMEDTGIKLDSVASDLLGKSGQAMIAALIAGTSDPDVLAELAQGKLRAKLPALREALRGRFDAHHAVIIARILAHIDYLDEAITEISQEIEQHLAPLASHVELLCTIPGIARRTAKVLIAETGGDMSTFPTAKHLASWAGMCPDNDESADKRRSSRTRNNSKWLRATLIEAAKAASRTHNTYLAAQYQRLRPRPGANKATTPIAHSMLVAVWHILQTGELYNDPGPNYYTRRDPERTTRRLIAQLQRPGHTVTLQPATPPERGLLFRTSDTPTGDACQSRRSRVVGSAGMGVRVLRIVGLAIFERQRYSPAIALATRVRAF